MRSKKIKTRIIVEECLNVGITSPSLIRDTLARRGKRVTDNAITMQIKRLGIDRKAIEEKIELDRRKPIMENQRVRDYLTQASVSGITQRQIDGQLKHLQCIYEWMQKTPPETWSYQALIDVLKQHYPIREDERGRIVFEKPHAVADYLSAVNTIFPSVMPRGWSAGFTREAGELKDYLTFEEFQQFCSMLTDTIVMKREGWEALFKAQVNGAMREGNKQKTGILSLRWEDIDYTTRRCQVREKGGRGHAARMWKNVPLDLFPWLHGWEALMTWHQLLYGYIPTNESHETGRVFAVSYPHYRKVFHETRKRCNGRIAGDGETLKPHVLRKTHAQWCVKLWIPIEQICGIFPDGWFGVGWDNPLILLKYYITLETEQRLKAEETMTERMQKLGLAPLNAWEKAILGAECAFLPRIEESHSSLVIQP